MDADIAKARRTKQGIRDGMEEDVGVRVAQKPFLEWDVNPAKYQLAALDKPVYVIAYTGPNSHARRPVPFFCASFFSRASAITMSSGVVILMFE